MLNYSRENRVGLLKSAQLSVEMLLDANAINLKPDDEIYRIFSFSRFLKILKSGKNTLIRPSLWKDPFENILFNHRYVDEGGHSIDVSRIRDSWYGQCWTHREAECDGLWRVYSDNQRHRCVRVKSTVEKIFKPLLESLWDKSTNQDPEHTCFIGKVDYSFENEIMAVLESFAQPIASDPTNINQMQMLLTKRNSFSYEQEVRILYFNGHKGKSIHKYKIDVNEVFDEVMVDPWCSEQKLRCLVKKMRNAGFQGDINKSRLYAPVELTTVIV